MQTLRRQIALTLVAVVAPMSLSTVIAAPSTFESLGILGSASSGPDANITADGNIVATTSPLVFNGPTLVKPDPMVWSSCTNTIQFSEAFATEAYVLDISLDGNWLIGTVYDTNSKAAFRMSLSGDIETIGSPIGQNNTEAVAASADGDAIACTVNGRIYRWTAQKGFEPVGENGVAIFGDPSGISADGSTIVGTGNSVGAFRWQSDGTFDVIAADGVATAVSPDGGVVVGYAGNDEKAYRWTAATGLVILDAGAVNYPRPSAVSTDGALIVGYW
ncbi:MAG: hypothetical protein H6819_00435 [Phycisphaerales bacterium]|nr:hypothetical protein [Phycisphaerales bacterium]MCB9857324.1 hypothetical protein [Phycisphaerales bacterium]MCB9862962.1 hypothetical protein [Phycisphaerales bacterium]